jgi:Protein of unknown function (DUF2785)
MIRQATALFFALLLSCGSFAAGQQHDRQFWRSIAKNRYAVPEHESADTLALELSSLLGSADPDLRDDLAYSILGTWIHRNVLSRPTLIALTDEWRANLTSGIGESGTNSVLKRSFSALCLSEMAKHEAKGTLMGPERYQGLVTEAISYLQSERDLRGYDAELRWIHATAHTADLLAALADSPMLTREQAANMLRAIASRLSTAPQVYTQGEQDRLAVAVVSVIRRKDFDTGSFEPWLAAIQNEDRNVWTNTTVESLACYQNHNYFLQALTVRLSLETSFLQMEQYRQKVLDLLKNR